MAAAGWYWAVALQRRVRRHSGCHAVSAYLAEVQLRLRNGAARPGTDAVGKLERGVLGSSRAHGLTRGPINPLSTDVAREDLRTQDLYPLLLRPPHLACRLADLAIVIPQVDRRGAEQGQQLRDEQATDDGDAERLAHFRTDAEADRQRQCRAHRHQRGHGDRA